MTIGRVCIHHGVCDASAAVFLEDGSLRFLVADDEDAERTILRTYEAEVDGPPVAEYRLDSAMLQPDPEEPEIDLEGSAWLGERIFWIGSHSRSRKGKPRPSRHRLFATSLHEGAPIISGQPCCDLLRHLEQSLGRKLDVKEPPKKGGVSIEGLSGSPNRGELLIAFRNPLIGDKALIVPLANADAVVDSGAPPQMGEPILLDLDGRGIRSLEYWPERTSWLLIAGPEGDGDEPYALMRWSGPGSSRPEVLDFQFDRLGIRDGAPEGLLIHRPTDRVFILFDEGNRLTSGGAKCKDSVEQSFRSVSIEGLLPPVSQL